MKEGNLKSIGMIFLVLLMFFKGLGLKRGLNSLSLYFFVHYRIKKSDKKSLFEHFTRLNTVLQSFIYSSFLKEMDAQHLIKWLAYHRNNGLYQ